MGIFNRKTLYAVHFDVGVGSKNSLKAIEADNKKPPAEMVVFYFFSV